MPRSPSAVPGATRFAADGVSSRAVRVAVQCWAASTGWPGVSLSAVTWRRSAPQQLVRLMVLGQVPGGLSPARPPRPRGACPQPGQVSQSRTRWVVQAKVQPSRQASSHRPPSSARHGGQYRDPRRRTGPSGRWRSRTATSRRPAGSPARCSRRRSTGAGMPATRPPGLAGTCQPSAAVSVPTLTWLRRASASSQLSRASPATIGTRSGSVRPGLTRRRPAACPAGPGRLTAARRRTRRPAGGGPARRLHRSGPGPAARRSGPPRPCGSR